MILLQPSQYEVDAKNEAERYDLNREIEWLTLEFKVGLHTDKVVA